MQMNTHTHTHSDTCTQQHTHYKETLSTVDLHHVILPTAIHNKLWSVKHSNNIATGSQLHHQYRITNEKEGASKVTVHIGGSIRHYTQWFIPSSYLSSPTQ